MTSYGVSGVTKSFAGLKALDDVSLEIGRGQIHALLGGNGSGKSTLVKILAGVLDADAGTVTIGDTTTPAHDWSVAKARAAGIHVVHQHGGTFEEFSVAENLAIGRGFEQGRAGAIRWRATHARAVQILERFEIDATPQQKLGTLRPAGRMMIAIARALQDQEHEGGGLLILDEPTAALPNDDAELVASTLSRYAATGQSVLFVSHRLDEVLRLASVATVFRDGRVVDERRTEGLHESELVELMVGHKVRTSQRRTSKTFDGGVPTVLRLENVVGGAVRGASLTVRPGEIVGVAGLLGSGRSQLLRIVFGSAPTESGDICVADRPVRFRRTGDAMRAGIALVPEDRATESVLPDLSLRENFTATRVAAYWRRLRLSKSLERRDATAAIAEYHIVAQDTEATMATLSGGNQQKVVLARWLARDPKLLLLDEPTHGVDAHAREQLYDVIREVTRRGAGVLAVASDFEELVRLCDRVVVMVAGRTTQVVQGDELNLRRLTELAYGFQSVPRDPTNAETT